MRLQNEIMIETYRFDDDGVIPNSPLPVILYRGAMSGDRLEAQFKAELRQNGWGAFWVADVYDFHHYHSTAHEFLACVQGEGVLRIGGHNGTTFKLKEGDAIVLPAGTGHKDEGSSEDFLVLGAYPDRQGWDICTGKPEDRERELENIRKLPVPDKDPLYGSEGPLTGAWNSV